LTVAPVPEQTTPKNRPPVTVVAQPGYFRYCCCRLNRAVARLVTIVLVDRRGWPLQGRSGRAPRVIAKWQANQHACSQRVSAPDKSDLRGRPRMCFLPRRPPGFFSADAGREPLLSSQTSVPSTHWHAPERKKNRTRKTLAAAAICGLDEGGRRLVKDQNESAT